jgi:PAS domain S-box-containing protein
VRGKESVASKSSAGKRKGGARKRASAAAIQAGLDRLPIGFALFDSKWRLAAWNGALASICGYPESLLSAGTPVQDFLRFNAERGDYGAGKPASLVRKRLAVLSLRKPAVREQRLADGSTLRISTRPVPPGYRLVTFEDVSEARLAEERYDVASRAINEGIYDWDIATGKIYYSERVYDLLGFSSKDYRTVAGWRNRIHPDDLPRFDAGIVAHLKGATERFECDYRFRARDGNWRWARQHGIALRDASGRAIRLIGSTGDINELKRTEEALKQSEERYTLAMRAATEGVYEWDLETGKLYISDTTKVFFWSKLESLTPKAWNERVHPDDFDAYREAIAAHFKGLKAHFEHEYRVRDPAGGYTWVLDRGIAVRNAAGRAIRLVGAVSDITQRKLAEQELRRAHEETGAALERQTATAEILKVIASSPSNVQPVLDAVAASAARLCEARDAIILLREGDVFRFAAHYGTIPNLAVGGTRRLSRDTTVGRSILEGRQIHVRDLQAEDQEFPEGSAYARQFGYHTSLVTPLMREGIAIGSILIRRAEIKPFSEAQMDLVTTFADQAVIAIENVRLFNETKEALERQTATAEILKVIASSPSDVQPVFDAIAANARELCRAINGAVFTFDGALINYAASDSVTPQGVDAIRQAFPMAPGRTGVTARAVLTRAIAYVPDVREDSGYGLQPLAQAQGFRSALSVPMLLSGNPIGAITVTGAEPGMFSERQIAMLQTFADQAVIAIENVRLFNETKEALERQTATAEILQVIGSSPTDAQPVFDAIVNSGVRLFPGAMITVARPDGEAVRAAAIAHENTAMVAGWRERFTTPLSRDRLHAAAILDAKLIDFPDAEAEKDGPFGPGVRNFLRSGNRAVTIMPMLRGEGAIGAISVVRAVPGPLSDKQIAMLRTFASQAVIAIENVRLFNEINEALKQQTATAEVLKAISRTTFDLDTVLQTLLESAARLTGALNATLYRPDSEGNYLPAATYNVPADSKLLELVRKRPLRAGRDSTTGRALLERRVVHVPDVLADPEYQRLDLQSAGQFRTVAAVPMLRDGDPTGLITFTKDDEGRGFNDKQLRLMTTFADQAAIAIENVRLFNETKEALEQQKASGEVLAAISSSIADAQPVFDKIIESCERLFAGRIVGLNLVSEDGLIRIGAYHGPGREELERIFPLPVNSDSGSGLAIVEARVVHYPDAQHGEEVPAATRQGCAAIGIRSAIFSPVLWEGRGIGVIFVGRDFVSSFSEKEISLLHTFCDQAAIAIQNARLFREIRQKSAQLEIASHHKSQFLASMSHELRTPLNAILGFNEMILDGIYGELPEDVKAPLENMQSSGKHLLRLINNVLDLAKIEAGRMELSLSDYSVQDTVASVHSTLKAIATDKGLEFLASVPNDVPLAYGDGGRIAQCLMNLAGNSLKFTKAGKVEIAVEQKDSVLLYRVADTGIGIPPDKIGSLFTEFKQTDATIASEYGGTGLGLSISRKFIEMHGGRIWVESEPGKGSTFLFEIPLRVAQ